MSTAFANEPDDQPTEDTTEAKSATASRRPFAIPDLEGFAILRLLAETYADSQDHRKRIMNRLGLKADGTAQVSGARVPVEYFSGLVDADQQAEHLAGLALVRAYRRYVPAGVIAWQKGTFGIGEHLLARLLGAIGHPRIATPYHWAGTGKDRTLIADPPFERTLRQLWAYCGHGDPARKVRKGMTAEELFTLGSPNAKMLTHLLAEAAMKTRLSVEEYEVMLSGCETDAGRAYVEEQLTKLRTAASNCATEATGRAASGAESFPDQPSVLTEAMARAAGLDPSPGPEPTPSTEARDRPAGVGAPSTEPIPATNAIRSAAPSPDPSSLVAEANPFPAGRDSLDGPGSRLAPGAKNDTASDRRYRRVYDLARVRYADRVHADPCVRCGPSGKPAEPGSAWSAAHQHAAALRLVGKEILRDLWLAAQ